MGYLTPLYDRALQIAAHKRASWHLAALSFAEASFFPIPPDTLLMPMTLARPQLWLRFAVITAIASVLGGAVGYGLGYFYIDEIYPWIVKVGYAENWDSLKILFARHGWLIVFVSGFTPIPYKLFTIGAGALGFAFVPFLIASFVGRSARFLMVAGIACYAGEHFAQQLRKNIDYFLLVVVMLGVVWWLFF